MNQDIFTLVEHIQGQVMEITYVLLAQARLLTAAAGGRVIAILPGSNASALAQDLAADEVWIVDHPALAEFCGDAYQSVLTGLLAQHAPRLMLFGETSIGCDIASGLSAHLGFPLVSNCLSICAEGAALRYTSQICGGKVMAEGEIPAGQTALITMLPGSLKPEPGRSAQPPVIKAQPAPDLSGLKMAVRRMIEPEKGDVDISKEPIVIAIGRGIQQKDNIELAEELAGELGGVLAGSRPIIDQGWLATSRLVGKSGKSVKPRFYLALGISGAPEHVEGMTGSETIIAVNTNPTAPIFNFARYGATVDMLDLLPVLSEEIRAVKGN